MAPLHTPELRAEVAPRHWQLGPRGHAGAQRLATALRRFSPFRLENSLEAKAVAASYAPG